MVTDELKMSSKPHSYQLQTLNINSALTKKAAGNIDINAMGDKGNFKNTLLIAKTTIFKFKIKFKIILFVFIALSTYRTQQTLTLDVLNSLHKSLETCPTSNILADDPQKLKVELMPHQKHAIAWLMWRESQKPHGGILGT